MRNSISVLDCNYAGRGAIFELESYEAPFLKERLVGKVFLNDESYEKSFKEFKRYISLIILGHKNVAMTSKSVDIIWHQFIIFTKEYHEFCYKFFGRYLHHVPETSSTPIKVDDRNRIFDAYKDVFNEDAPDVWGIKSNAKYVIEDLIPVKSQYLQDMLETTIIGGLLSFSDFGCRGCEECSGDGEGCKNSIMLDSFNSCDGCTHCHDGTG